MKKLILYVLLLPICSFSVAQQDPLYSQYINNPTLINPAYAGSTTDLAASAVYRKQWAGFEGSPVTMNANAHMALHNNRMGTGLIILQDKVGTDKTTEVTAMYSYHLPLNEQITLSFGLQGGIINYYSDNSDLQINPADTKFANISEWKPNLGTGIIVRSDKFFVSLSVPKLLKASSTIDQNTTSLYNQHFYAMGAYVFPLSYRLKLKPWVMARLVGGAPASADYGASLKIDDSYSFGLFTRNFDTYGFLAQFNLGDHLRVGYVFELPTNQSVGTQFTTHELTLGIRLGVLSFHDLATIRDF
ncbi:MAG: type IX secretion system membrane protein PorP/SprF [Cytophagales bacterium]|nr:type IX secretion system membrane protein PorP/SprF [Cytophagales bacterium]